MEKGDRPMKPIALTIAGSDSGGGAGIQADLKTFQELGVYGTSVITAVTAQNTLGVHGVYPLERNAVGNQLKAIGDDFDINAVKTGMLVDSNIIEEVAHWIKHFRWTPIVIDPVMVAKGGEPLLKKESREALKTELIPLAKVITPNLVEAELLTGINIHNDKDLLIVAERLLNMGAKAVVIKGGHQFKSSWSTDFFIHENGEQLFLRGKRILTKDTHGTGCTFSAAITSALANGSPVKDAIISAKKYIHAAIMDGLHIGKGHGPTNHWAHRKMNEIKDFHVDISTNVEEVLF
jgi:hydroxymethylpyrimidine/phosphomethylpyrimidine kinase